MLVSSEVAVRDGMGRFIADIEGAATQTIIDALKVGISGAVMKTPVKTGRLMSSYQSVVLSRTSGVFMNTAPHAEFQDGGTAPHDITANVSFFWEKMGRMWVPSPEGSTQVIKHPGHKGRFFMDAGYDSIQDRIMSIIKKNYPG